MDSKYDPHEVPAIFDDPNLPPTYAYGSGFFGELVSQGMLETGDVAPWSLEELDQPNNAPHVHADGQVDDQLQPPDYYAHSPHTESWEEGLQEIEDFDWSADKEDEQHACERDSKVQGEEDIGAASGSGADALVLIDQEKDLDLADGDVAHLHGRTDSPIAEPEGQIQNPEVLPPVNSATSIPEISEINALRPLIKHVGSNTHIVKDQHSEAQVTMDIDDFPAVADIGFEMNGDVIAAQETVMMPDLTAYQEDFVAGDIVTETESSTGLDDNQEVKPSTATSALGPPYHDGLLIHKKDLEISPRIVTASGVPLKETVIESRVLAALNSPHSNGNGEATYSVLEVPYQLETQNDEDKAPDQLQKDSAVPVQLDSDTLRPLSEGLPKAAALPIHPKAKSVGEAPEVGSEHMTFDQPTSFTLTVSDPTSSKPAGALSRIEESVDGPWRAQLLDATDEVSSDGLSGVLPLGYHGCNIDSTKPPPELTNEELSVPAHSPLTIPLFKQQLENNESLSPLPFALENDAARHEESEMPPAEAPTAKENVSATRIAYRSLDPPSPFKVEPPNTRPEDHVAVPDLKYSKTTVAIPRNGLVEGQLLSHHNDTVEALGSTTPLGSPRLLDTSSPLSSPPPISAPEAQLVHSRKRSKLARRTKNASETESEAPPRRKARESAPAKPRVSRVRKPSNGTEKQEIEPASWLAKIKRGAVNSKKETAIVNGADQDLSAGVPHGSASKLGHLAEGGHTRPSQQSPITDEPGNMVLASDAEMKLLDHRDNNTDMEEHCSDVEVPVTPSQHVPTADNVSSTPRSRQKVSSREVQGLSPAKYRERSSKAKWDTLPVSRRLFKPNTSNNLMSSAPVLEKSPAVPPSNGDLSVHVEGGRVTGSTLKMAKRSVAKPKATPTKTTKAKAKESPVTPKPNKKTPATRATKKQKIDSTERDEYDLCPTPKIDTTKPASLPEVPSPPRFSATTRRTTRSKKESDKSGEVTPSAGDKSLIDNTELDDEDPLSGIGDLEDRNDSPEDRDHDSDGEDEDFEDAQETIEAPDEYNASDNVSDATPPPSKKLKPKHKSLMLDGQSVSQLNSRTSTSAPSTASSTGTNKYGFKPAPHRPRTRQALKATAASEPVPVLKAKAKVPAKRKANAIRENKEEEREDSLVFKPEAPAKAKGKGRGPTACVPRATPEPSVRKSRRASAMEK